MEFLELVHPETGHVTGEALSRPEVIAKQAWCRTTNIFVLNSEGQVLCHQRSMQKERFPGVWMTHVGGHVGRGETYESNALKELEEEAGISVSPKDLTHWRTTKHEKSRLWIREFVAHTNVPAHELVPQPGEVERFQWFRVEEILEAVQKNPEQWCAGTHFFQMEYYCFRSALVASMEARGVEIPGSLHSWVVERI